MLVVSDEDAVKSLPLDTLLAALREGLINVADDKAIGLPRARFYVTDTAYVSLMGAADPDKGIASKVLVSDPELRHENLPTQHAVITLYDYRTGAVRAIINGREVGAIRTAATAAMAVIACRGPEPKLGKIAVIGGGHQALTAVKVLHEIFAPDEISFFARTQASRDTISQACPFATVADTLDEVVADADVISLCTRPTEPILYASMVKPGATVTSIGSGEIADDLITTANVLVEAPESRQAPPVGCLELSQHPDVPITLIGDVLSGKRSVPADGEQINVFKSMGHAIEDLVAADAIVAGARAAGLGAEVDF